MTELLVGGSVWWVLPGVLIMSGAIFGFFPGFVLRVLVLLYPVDDPRRRELVAELYTLGRIERIEWVFQQLETALFEGVSARLERRRDRRHGLADDSTGEANATDLLEAEELESVKRRKFLAHATAVAIGAHVLGTDRESTRVWSDQHVRRQPGRGGDQGTPLAGLPVRRRLLPGRRRRAALLGTADAVRVRVGRGQATIARGAR